MTKEKILLIGDSCQGPTGFANSGVGIAWSLAEKFDVHYLGLQSFQDEKVGINMEGSQRTTIQHANLPRGKERWDFGRKSLPQLLDRLEPDVVITINDIQMIQHVPSVMCPNQIKLNVIDLPAKKFLSEEALKRQMLGELQRFKEIYPRENKWIAYSPQDGDPPMPQWSNIYKMADQVVSMSKYGQWVFKNWYGMDVPYIWHGVDTAVFNNRPKPDALRDKFVVGNINRNQPRKQPVRTMIAFSKFAKDKPDVLLHMQMDWHDEFGWPLDYFAQLYKIAHLMIKPAPVGMPREKVADTYNMWDLNTMLTSGEGFGLPFAEGGACGLPVLATEYTTSKELVMDGEPSPRGTLVKVSELHWQKMDVAAVRRALIDIEDATNAMNKYYYNRDLLIQHGKNAEEWYKANCSWKVIGKQWIDLVEKVLSDENS